MNCKQISRFLEESEPAGVPAAESAEIETHLRECETCAEQYRVSSELLAFRSAVPPVPASLTACARRLDAVCEPVESSRKLRRPLIISGLFLFGATSAMLASLQWPGEKAELVE